VAGTGDDGRLLRRRLVAGCRATGSSRQLRHRGEHRAIRAGVQRHRERGGRSRRPRPRRAPGLLVPRRVLLRRDLVSRRESRHGTARGAAPTATPTPSAATLPPGAFRKIGDSYQSGPLTITVTGTEVHATIAGGATPVPAAEGTYLFVYFTLVLGGEQPLSFDYDSFVVIDSAGQGYLHDPVATNAALKPAVPNGTDAVLQPGVSYNLVIVFDVPKTSSGFVLRARDGTFPVQLDR